MLELRNFKEDTQEIHKNTRMPEQLFMRVFSTGSVVKNIIGTETSNQEEIYKISQILDTAMSRIENGQSIIGDDSGSSILTMINSYNELTNQDKKKLINSYGEDFSDDFVRVRKLFHSARLKNHAANDDDFEQITKKIDPFFDMSLLAA